MYRNEIKEKTSLSGLVSVVIPVYNVEKYLRECLDSVVGQTYKNLQIILVDDGSTDTSGAICDEYAKKDERITVVHQENQGAGAAKNIGLELVEGEYLSLIDSDDYIDEKFYETMIRAMEKYNADVAQCLFTNLFADHEIKRKYYFPAPNTRKMSTKRYLFEILYDWKYAIFANKVFKTKLLGEAKFPVGRKIDDEFFTYKLICKAKNVVNVNEHLYHYRMRQSSVMNDNSRDKLNQDRLECFKERYDYIIKKYPSLENEYYRHLSEQFDELYPSRKATVFQRLRRKILLRGYVSNIGENIAGEYYE